MRHLRLLLMLLPLHLKITVAPQKPPNPRTHCSSRCGASFETPIPLLHQGHLMSIFYRLNHQVCEPILARSVKIINYLVEEGEGKKTRKFETNFSLIFESCLRVFKVKYEKLFDYALFLNTAKKRKIYLSRCAAAGNYKILRLFFRPELTALGMM